MKAALQSMSNTSYKDIDCWKVVSWCVETHTVHRRGPVSTTYCLGLTVTNECRHSWTRSVTCFTVLSFGNMCKQGERTTKSRANKLNSPRLDFPGYPETPIMSPRRTLAWSCTNADGSEERLHTSRHLNGCVSLERTADDRILFTC